MRRETSEWLKPRGPEYRCGAERPVVGLKVL
jgi:hypothetical protein